VSVASVCVCVREGHGRLIEQRVDSVCGHPEGANALPRVCVSMNIVKWSSQGMLRLTQEAMNELFQPTVVGIVKHIGERRTAPRVQTRSHRPPKKSWILGSRTLE